MKAIQGVKTLVAIGVWKSWQREGLDIKDIVWPGNSHTPPQGVPEKFHLKITFLEEPPYIKLAPPDPVTGKCSLDRGVLCRVASDADLTHKMKRGKSGKGSNGLLEVCRDTRSQILHIYFTLGVTLNTTVKFGLSGEIISGRKSKSFPEDKIDDVT
ncbi:hypothetical protein WA026_013049 [Henosepilachna vigintioctopunctata]|uniref:Uncharacterized protein n=1 Tax=Henosepilachna vigintioctopunctata TaxID=420089 RepID=A0AAW1ULS3_9CUCU